MRSERERPAPRRGCARRCDLANRPERRVYFDTLLDENAAAHIAFGQGFTGTRTERPLRGVNRASAHLDVMIGGPDLEVTGVTAKGRRLPLIRDGLWQI